MGAALNMRANHRQERAVIPKYLRGYVFPNYKSYKAYIEGPGVEFGATLLHHVRDHVPVRLPTGMVVGSVGYQRHIDTYHRGRGLVSVESKTQLGLVVRVPPHSKFTGRLLIHEISELKSIDRLLDYIETTFPALPVHRSKMELLQATWGYQVYV
jgi:hypothetical protein